jgi:hypothetical protein
VLGEADELGEEGALADVWRAEQRHGEWPASRSC